MCYSILTCLTKIRLCCCRKKKYTIVKFYDFDMNLSLTKRFNDKHPQVRGDLVKLIKPDEISKYKIVVFESELGYFAYYIASLYLTEDILYPVDMKSVLENNNVLYAYTDKNEDIGYTMERFYDPFEQIIWSDYKKIFNIDSDNIIGTKQTLEDEIFEPKEDTLIINLFEKEEEK